MNDELETEQDPKDDSELWRVFTHDIECYDKKFETWKKDGDDTVNRYRDESVSSQSDSGGSGRVAYNILWSNVQTLKPSYYSRTPKIVAERRWKDADPIGRLAAKAAERAAQYSLSIEQNSFNSIMDMVVEDRLLPGRGIAWQRYEPQIESSGDADSPLDTLVDAKVVTDYVHWKDFGHNEGKTWNDVTAVWKRVFMSKDECKKRFGEAAKDLSYGDLPADVKNDIVQAGIEDHYKRATIYERWDKARKKVYWFSKNMKDKFLDVQNDPLHLQGFFPCPSPLYATLTSNTLVPVADYRIYKTLAEDLDYITRRKSSLVEMVKCISAHDASMNDIMIRMQDLEDGDSIPIKNWVAFAEKGGIKNAMAYFPLETVAQTINLLTAAQADLLQKIYEVSGMSDIVRGTSNPYESAAAQQIKGNFATLRLAKNQSAVQRFVAELAQIKAEIIFAVIDGEPLFDDDMIANMIGLGSFDQDEQQLWPQALELLRSDKMRTFRVDLETDSFLAIDEQMDKEAANEFMGAFGNMLNQSFTMVQVEPELLPLMLEITKFVARRYRTGKTVEAMVERTFDSIMQKRNQPPPEPQPDPAMIELQMKGQMEQANFQLEQQKAQHKAQMEELLAQHKIQLEQFETQSKTAMAQQKLEMTSALKMEQIKAQQVTQQMQAYLNAASQSANATKQPAQTPAPITKPSEPVVVNVVMPKESPKKIAKFSTDPMTGERTAIVQEVSA